MHDSLPVAVVRPRTIMVRPKDQRYWIQTLIRIGLFTYTYRLQVDCRS